MSQAIFSICPHAALCARSIAILGPMNTPPDTPLRDISFPPTDQPLREDVNRLGALVGEILAEQRGEDFLALIEHIRTAAIQRRERKNEASYLRQTLSRMPPSSQRRSTPTSADIAKVR